MTEPCPYCGSNCYEVYDSAAVRWGSNDEGWVIEYIECLDCGRRFKSKAKVEVVERRMIE